MSDEAPARPFVVVGELLLSDGTRYTHFAVYEAVDMESALRRAAVVVRQWRGERVEGHPNAAVRDITEVQINVDQAA